MFGWPATRFSVATLVPLATLVPAVALGAREDTGDQEAQEIRQVSSPSGQEPSQDPVNGNGVEELAERLDKAHREGADQTVGSFSAKLQLDTVAVGQDALSVTLFADFATLLVGSRNRDFIKYRVQEEGQLIERGFHELGYWTKIDDKVTYLTAAEYEQDVEKVKRDIRLARQLLRYLDPAAVVRSLREPDKVRTELLKPGRGEAIPCLVVEGQLDAFPLYYHEGEAGRAFLKLWMEESSGRLMAVEAAPMNERGQPLTQNREFILLSEHKKDPNGGILLPTLLKISTPDAQGVLVPQITVLMESINLDPGLEVQDFQPGGE